MPAVQLTVARFTVVSGETVIMRKTALFENMDRSIRLLQSFQGCRTRDQSRRLLLWNERCIATTQVQLFRSCASGGGEGRLQSVDADPSELAAAATDGNGTKSLERVGGVDKKRHTNHIDSQRQKRTH